MWSKTVAILLTLFLAALLGGAAADAQLYPSRPVTLIVPYPAGGLSDLAARAIAHELSQRMNASFIIENRVGGSGTVGAGFVARSTPDGYTLLVNAPADVTNLHYMSLNYNILTDFTQIGMILEGPPLVLIASDQEWSSRALESTLGPQGYAVLRAYNGRQALEHVERAGLRPRGPARRHLRRAGRQRLPQHR